MDNIREIIMQCQEDSENMFPATAMDISYHTLSLAGEVGEFCNELKKVARGSQSMQETYPRLSDELVDVFIYVCTIASVLKIDLGVEYDIKREFNVRRFFSNERTRTADDDSDGEG